MADKKGRSSTLLKIGVALALVAGAVMGASYALRSVVTVAPAVIGTAADAVAGSVVVHADGDLKELKSEVGGRVAAMDLLTPDGLFKEGDVLLQIETIEIERQIEDAKRGRATEEARQRVIYADNPEWIAARSELDAAERALAEKKGPETAVAQAQTKLNAVLAKYNLERLAAERDLIIANRSYERREISRFEVEQKEVRLKAIETRLREAAYDAGLAKQNFELQMQALERTKERMSIRAPEAGQISEVRVFRGALINGGQTLATWFSNERIVVAKVSEEDISRVKLGQSAQVTLLKFPGEYFKAHVVKILTSADPDTQRYTVHLKVDTAAEKLVPFATGEVTITIDEQADRLLVMRRAIFDDTWVAVVVNGRVERRKVEVGYRGLNQAEIKSGLAKGEQVIVDQPEVYENGQWVRVNETKFY